MMIEWINPEMRYINKAVLLYQPDMEGNREKGGTKRSWIGGVKDCLGVRGQTIQKVYKCLKDRREWNI